MDFAALVEQGVGAVLTWIGFGTLVGMVAKAILPGKDPGGVVGTIAVGILGSIMGAGTLLFYWPEARVTPLSVIGFGVGTVGAMALLLVYRVLAGRLFRESGYDIAVRKPRLRRVVTSEEQG
jgi:uncharacterized membrane protein YeaQ/YmgE (transglycosylase-associated protein family)